MAGFAGAIVEITLKQPPGTIVQGKVKDVVNGQLLQLQDVFFTQSSTRWPHWSVQNNIIEDLVVLQASTMTAQPPTVQLPVRTAPSQQLSTPPHVQTAASQPVDPAILSFERTPARKSPIQAAELSATPTRTVPAKVAQTQRVQSKPQQSVPADMRQAFEEAEAEVEERAVKKHQRQPKQKIAKKAIAPTEPPVVLNTDVSRNGNDMTVAKRGKGWRQTPLLQPTQAEAAQPKKRRRQRQVDGEAQNGWATEDATDIQDLGEFDFEANHKLFDKQQVFEQLRKDDTTADEDRLVSHNKLPPRKNLLPTEMVLSPKLAVQDSDTDTEIDLPAVRSSSRHSMTKRQGSRTNSGYLDGRPHPLTASMSSDRAGSRSATSRSRAGKPLHLTTSNKLRSGGEQSPRSAISHKSRSTEPIHSTSPHFIIGKSRTPCPVLLPDALETLEEQTEQYGVSSEAITELAARCIAEETLKMIDSPSEIRRPSRTNTARSVMTASTTLGGGQPVIVVLAGNHTTGAEALAAVRHLVCRKYKVIVAEGVFEISDVQHKKFAVQQQALKRAIRAGANIKRGKWRKALNHIVNLPGPPVAIIDALFAGTTYDDLKSVEKTSYATALEDAREAIDWANRSRAPVISIASPSGVSGIDGSAAIVDGEPLAVRPDRVLALGAPMLGLLEAMRAGEQWDVNVADIGINIALKVEDAVEFGAQWVTPVMLSSD